MSSAPFPDHSLRPFVEADAEELHALIERNREQLARWLAWAAGQTLEHTLKYIRGGRERESAGEALDRAILATGRIVGSVAFPKINHEHRSAEIGYWLDQERQGAGIMTAAVATLADHAFDQLGLVRLEIRTDVENGPSRGVAERLGFTHEGTLRQAYRIAEGRYSDDALYALLASDGRPPGARLEGV